jgi:hypothetical protein
MFSAVAAVECFITEFPLISDFVEEKRDKLGGPVGESCSICVAVVAALETVNIMHCLEILGELVGIHETPADSVMVSECLSEKCVWTDGVMTW